MITIKNQFLFINNKKINYSGKNANSSWLLQPISQDYDIAFHNTYVVYFNVIHK